LTLKVYTFDLKIVHPFIRRLENSSTRQSCHLVNACEQHTPLYQCGRVG